MEWNTTSEKFDARRAAERTRSRSRRNAETPEQAAARRAAYRSRSQQRRSESDYLRILPQATITTTRNSLNGPSSSVLRPDLILFDLRGSLHAGESRAGWRGNRRVIREGKEGEGKRKGRDR